MTLTLSKKDSKEDIPTLKIESRFHAWNAIGKFVNRKEAKGSIFVVFLDTPSGKDDFNNQHNSFIVSHKKKTLMLWISRSIFHVWNDLISLNIFEFESYKEAFKYCTVLKQGF